MYTIQDITLQQIIS